MQQLVFYYPCESRLMIDRLPTCYMDVYREVKIELPEDAYISWPPQKIGVSFRSKGLYYIGEQRSEDWRDREQEFLPAAWIIEIDGIKSIFPAAEEYVGEMRIGNTYMRVKFFPAKHIWDYDIKIKGFVNEHFKIQTKFLRTMKKFFRYTGGDITPDYNLSLLFRDGDD